jgi:hypothetical protein
MKKKRMQEGDIFYVQISRKYVFGRILLDVDERILKLEPQHKYKFYSGCYLAVVYKGVYDEPILTSDEIGLPSQFVFKKYFHSKSDKIDCFFYEHQPVDYREIDFPEVLEGMGQNYINFRKFDVAISTRTLHKDWPEYRSGHQKYTGSICSTFYQMADEAFHLQGRDDLMQDKERTYFLSNDDLRLSVEDRSKFYSQIKEYPNISYYELALKHGFDLARFY